MTKESTKRLHRSEVPEEFTWELSSLFSSHKEWEEELLSVSKDIHHIARFQGKLTNATAIFLCLEAYETFLERCIQLSTYASLRLQADGTNPAHQEDQAKVANAMAKIASELSFIKSELLTHSKEDIKQFLIDEPALNRYKKTLEDMMKEKPYTLAPDIEKTLAALENVHSAPYMIYERSKTSDMSFPSIQNGNGKDLPMSAALHEEKYEVSEDTVLRRNSYHAYIQTLNNYKHTFAATYATEVNKQVTFAKLRGYDSVTRMLLQPQEVTEQMYHHLLDIIQEELAPHMRRFAKLKQKSLGLTEMRYSDLKAPLDPTYQPKTSYNEAKETILHALKVMGPTYLDIIKKGLTERWVDLSDNIGKSTGAFCASPYGAHPYILLTWADSMESTFTLAHELGHAGHFYLANKHQSLFNTDVSTYFVEAPSTLNELLLGQYLFKQANDKQMKRWVITQLLATYYHNFVTHLLEGEFQRRIYRLAEEGRPLTADVLSNQKLETLRRFWGDTVQLDEGAGLTWMRQPHYYMGLYPYTYAAGLSVSTAVAQMIQDEGKPAVDRWLDVLKLGGTMSPLALMKQAGIDMSGTEPIQKAVAYVGTLVDELEKSYENV